MKQFFIILKFEFLGLVRAKAFIITTTIFVLVSVIGLSLPSILGDVDGGSVLDSTVEQSTDESNYVVYDANGLLQGEEKTIQLFFPNAKFEAVDSIDKLEKMVKEETVDAGFEIKEDYAFIYYVNDSNLSDMTSSVYSEAMSQVKRNMSFEEVGLNSQQIMDIYYQNTIVGTTVALGSDGANNIIYTFILMFLIYMVIVMYGNIIATTVASEKGNRTMELLVTSANANALIFGKVLAGALTAFLQVAIFLGSAITTYRLNGEAWNGMLDMVFDIPTAVISAFAIFGILGFLFYSFIFGALGALVSKSEDVNSSSTPVTIVFVAVYFVIYVGIMNPASLIFKVASFVPFSSPMAMFARMAMVEVPLNEIIISLLILVVSTIIIGFGAAKIYRRGTLMYGNQIKFTHALKWLKKSKD